MLFALSRQQVRFWIWWWVDYAICPMTNYQIIIIPTSSSLGLKNLDQSVLLAYFYGNLRKRLLLPSYLRREDILCTKWRTIKHSPVDWRVPNMTPVSGTRLVSNFSDCSPSLALVLWCCSYTRLARKMYIDNNNNDIARLQVLFVTEIVSIFESI